MATRIGRVIRSVGGYHTVLFPDGQELLLQARGILKREGTILVGDRVEVRMEGSGGVVERTLERDSQLFRPPIANVEVVLVVFAVRQPPPVLDLLDRILAQVEQEQLEAVITFNKVELIDEKTALELAEPYQRAGYSVVFASAKKGDGMEELTAHIGQRIAVMTGPSGVGKTSLINRLVEDASMETQAVSEKTSRGRHTTRAVSLLRLNNGGWIADTPGFSTLNLGIVEPRVTPTWYREFATFSDQCRFSSCLHRSEPGCAVREAVDEGHIDRGRYERFLKLLAEVEEAYERRYY